MILYIKRAVFCISFLITFVFISCDKNNPVPEPALDMKTIQVTNLKVDPILLNGTLDEQFKLKYYKNKNDILAQNEAPSEPLCGDIQTQEENTACEQRYEEWITEHEQWQERVDGLIAEAKLPEVALLLYSLEEGKVIPPEELNSTKWDIALAVGGTLKNIIIVNNKNPNLIGTQTVPGGVLGALLPVAFDDMKEAPDPSDGLYLLELDEAGKNRYPKEPKAKFYWGSNGTAIIGWWDHARYAEMGVSFVKPVKNHTFVFRTIKGNYAKLQMQSVYKDSPESPDRSSEYGYLTFRYYVQKDGSRNLNTGK